MSVRDEAKADWMRGMKYKDIAQKYNIKESTVKSWATRYWKTDRVVSGQKKVAKKVANSKKVATLNKTIDETVTEAMYDTVSQNDELTDKQKDFCLYFMQTKNAVQSYIKAYNASYTNACSNSHSLLINPKIQKELQKLREIKKTAITYMTADDVIEMHMKIAFADITDYVSFESVSVPVISNGKVIKIENPKTGEEKVLTKKQNNVSIKNSEFVDGTIISEIGGDEGGIRIKLADRMKSLQFLERYFDLNPNDRHRKAFDEAKLDIEKQKLELMREERTEIEDIEDMDGELYSNQNIHEEENDTV